MLGAMSALYCTLRYSNDSKLLWGVLAGVALFLAILAKENAITFLAVIPLSLYFFSEFGLKRILRISIPIILATIAYLILRFQVIGFVFSSGNEITDLMNNPFVEMDGSEKLATILYTLLYYLKLLVVPHPLTHDYYPYHIPLIELGAAYSLFSCYCIYIIDFYCDQGIEKKSMSLLT